MGTNASNPTFRRQPPSRPNPGGAFTLVELLIVIAIIGLLVAIVLPSLSRAKQIGRRTVCQTRLHGVGAVFRMYLDESNDIMPDAAAMPSKGLSDGPRIVDVLSPRTWTILRPCVARLTRRRTITNRRAAATSTI